MRFFIKDKGANRAEAWLEVWVHTDWEVVCEAYLITNAEQILIDDIKTDPRFRRQGYATVLVEHIKMVSENKKQTVAPIGIKNTPEALGFWKSLEMTDALGKEL